MKKKLKFLIFHLSEKQRDEINTPKRLIYFRFWSITFSLVVNKLMNKVGKVVFG